MVESKILRILHPTYYMPIKRGFVSLFYLCKRPEKRAFMVGSLWAWLHVVKREEESFLLLCVQKPKFQIFGPLGLGRENKLEETSPYFFHLFISSRSPSSTPEKVLKI